MEAGKNTSTVIPASRKRRRKGNRISLRGDSASRPKRRLMRNYFWISLFTLWEPSMGTSHRLPKPVSRKQLINRVTNNRNSTGMLRAVSILGWPQGTNRNIGGRRVSAYLMPDCCCIRKVLRPTISINVFRGFPWSQSKC
jgi:hypothetical protein